MRVFVGAGANGEDAEAQAVLEYTLKKHSSMPIDITWMQLSTDTSSPFYSAHSINEGWHPELWSSPFQGFKWAVPAICEYKGRAIYIDCDFVVKGDIAELWRQELNPNTIAIAHVGSPAPRFDCCLWDCAAAKNYVSSLSSLMADVGSHQQHMMYFASHPHLITPFADGEWGALDSGYALGETGKADILAYHCSRMSVQPYMRHAVPRLARLGREHWFTGTVLRHPSRELEAKFDGLLSEAKEAGHPVGGYTNGLLYGDYNFHRSAGAPL